jgi:hypothetical protein
MVMCISCLVGAIAWGERAMAPARLSFLGICGFTFQDGEVSVL